MTARKQRLTITKEARATRLVKRAAGQGVRMDSSSAKALARLRVPEAICRLDRVCNLVRAGDAESITVSFRHASRLLDICDGNLDEAVRRVIAGGAELREGVPELVDYAAERGMSLSPQSICYLLSRHGRRGVKHHIDKLSDIMDEAATMGIDCTQTRASRRLSAANGDAQRVIDGLAAERRRRLDREIARCRVVVPPRTLGARTNAFAGCGCRRCLDRLVNQMQPYINAMIAAPFFALLGREEARSEANLALIPAVEKWPGGPNFAGYFGTCVERRVCSIYRGRFGKDREVLSLDADAVRSSDEGGRLLSLMDRVPDRSIDPLAVILMHEQKAETEFERHRLCIERVIEYEYRSAAGEASSSHPRTPLRVELLVGG